jgi:hypothetical protein
VPWSPLPDPFTLAGDAGWSDYTIAADVLFLSGAPATLLGRIDSANVFRDARARWPSGYIFRVKPDGGWDLLSAQYKQPVATLALGSTPIHRDAWHHLELRFHGNRITALLDGTQLTAIDDSTHTHGMFGLGTEWNRIQFDNLRIAPAD